MNCLLSSHRLCFVYYTIPGAAVCSLMRCAACPRYLSCPHVSQMRPSTCENSRRLCATSMHFLDRATAAMSMSMLPMCRPRRSAGADNAIRLRRRVEGPQWCWAGNITRRLFRMIRSYKAHAAGGFTTCRSEKWDKRL